MLTSDICLIVMAVIAIIAVISLVLTLHSKWNIIASKVFMISFAMFLVMVCVTAYFKGQEAPHCPICETIVETNYCPDCGTAMR